MWLYGSVTSSSVKVGDRQEALKQIRECVKLDGDHKPVRRSYASVNPVWLLTITSWFQAFKFYKMLKKFNKAADKIADLMSKSR